MNKAAVVSLAFCMLMLSFGAVSQNTSSLQIDLSDKNASTIQIDFGLQNVTLINKSHKFNYKGTWKRKTITTPMFDIAAITKTGTSSAPEKLVNCSKNVQKAIVAFGDDDESKIKIAVKNAMELIDTLADGDCKTALKEKIKETKETIDFQFKGTLANNQIITLEITKSSIGGTEKGKWTYTFATEEKSRWLVHYGLSYVPNVISRVDHFHSFADTGVANKFTITKDNSNGPKPWENISATINFTYPFHADSRQIDGGFTAGFGLNPGFELSGHTGVSAVIGENVIIGTGFAFMQKSKLRGEYKENQVIKTNLNFDALHQKVWLPELYFTIGFRFAGNPFNSKSSNNNPSSTGSSGSTNANSNSTNSSSSNPDNKKSDTTAPKNDSTKVDTTKSIGFIPIKLDTKAIGSTDFEYSAITTFSNRLLLERQNSSTGGILKVIDKSKLLSQGLTAGVFTNVIVTDA